MKYCKHCGNQIPDNAVCNCPGAVAERQAQGGYAQPYPGQQPLRPRSANNPVNAVISTLKGYFKSPLQAVKDRQRANDLITPLILVGVMFFLLWGVNSCLFGNQAVILKNWPNISMTDYSAMSSMSSSSGMQALLSMYSKSYVSFNFGFVILASLIETLTLAVAYIGAKFIITFLFAKPANIGKAFTDAFISFGVNSIVPVIAMVIGGLFFMANGIIAQIFFGFAMIWYVATGLGETFEEVPAQKKTFVFYAVSICVVALMVFGYIMMYKLMWQMNTGHSLEDTTAIARQLQKDEDLRKSMESAKKSMDQYSSLSGGSGSLSDLRNLL